MSTPKDIAVIHLVRAANGLSPFAAFLESYRQTPQTDHDLILIWKGFDCANPPYRELLPGINVCGELTVHDYCTDLDAYGAAARAFDRPYLAFLNSFSVILDPHWLRKMFRILTLAPEGKPTVGLVGATGSYESFAGRSWLHRRFFPPFPNPHIRTNAFMMRRETMLKVWPKLLFGKHRAYLFESGKRGLTRQVEKLGLEVAVAGRDDAWYPSGWWPQSRTFRAGDQSNLLISDNQTRRFQYADQATRLSLFSRAWRLAGQGAGGMNGHAVIAETQFSFKSARTIVTPVRPRFKLGCAVRSLLHPSAHPPINLYLATSTVCNVQCKTCPVGRKEAEPGGMMSLEMLERILDKVTKEARVITVQMYHYNEPFLIPWIADMVRKVHQFGLPVFMSSNLVNFKHVPAVLEEAPATLLISVSGWSQETYERSHKNGDIEKVKDNMREVARLRCPGTHVQVSWHKYRYNEKEEHYMRAYAKMLGFAFVPYGTGLLPQDRAMRVWETGIEDPNGADCLVPVRDAKQLCLDRKHWLCLAQSQTLAVNGKGDYLNCSNRADDANIRGSLFATTVPAILISRRTDKACLACKAVGAHVYAQQHYTRSEYSPVRMAENIYRKLGLAGRLPAFSAWAARTFYLRPQSKETL